MMTDKEALSWLKGQAERSPYATECAGHLADRLAHLSRVGQAARRYSVATRDPMNETDDERKARHLERNGAWRDLNDALAR